MYLELRNLWKSYNGQSLPAVRGVTLEIRSGRTTALAGESGSGKTTLLRLVAGFESPDAGVIAHNGRLLSAPGLFVPPQKRSVAMIFQDLALFPHLTAEANVAFAMKHVTRRDRGPRSRALLSSVGLDGSAGKYPHELSGGQCQRVALARALASEAEIILMDEPFSNLDPELKWKLMDEVRSILIRERKTTVVVTHDRDEAFALADDIAIMEGGRLLQHGDAREVYRMPANHAVARFFGPVNRIPVETVSSGDVHQPFEELLVRPERCVIESRNGRPGPAAHPQQKKIRGTVSSSRFMGEFWEVEVTPNTQNHVGIGSLIVREKQQREKGERVWVVLPPVQENGSGQ